MKRIFALVSLAIFTFVVGCSINNTTTTTTTTNTDNAVAVNLDANKSLAFSTYMASGLLSSSTNTLTNMSSGTISGYKITFLTDEVTTQPTEEPLAVESELDEVNTYFNKLKVFMDNGVDSVLNVNEQASTVVGYDYEMTYSIENVTYTIYYSFVETTTLEETTEVEPTEPEEVEEEEELEEENEFQLNGLMIINGVNYELVGANEIDGEEQKMWFETIDTTNTGNSVKVEIKKENGEQKFEIQTVIDGVETSAEIKFEREENETKVELKLVENNVESSYEFKKEVENGETTYKLQYQIGDVEGEIKVVEMTDDLGNVTYKYEIEEDGKQKEVEKEDPDNDEEDDVEEEETDEETEVEESEDNSL